MDGRLDTHMMPNIAGAAFYQRLFTVWAGMFAAAMLYCLLRSLVDSAYSYEFVETFKWAAIHWGAWPILLPICIHLFRTVERRLSFVSGFVASIVFAIAGASLFAYLMGAVLGRGTSLSAATYHMAPIAAGTFVVFGVFVFWLRYPSVLIRDLDEAAVGDDETVMLKVWKGRVQTKIDVALVEWTRAARNYVELHAGGKSYLMRASMAELEHLLPSGRFLRTHRSYLVNTNFVVGVVGGNVRPSVVLESGSRLPVGKTYRDATLAAIERDAATA
jgi:DNA-binding LytR/AlgR family response regulator